MALFRASTRITVGDGNTAQFLLDDWSGYGAFCSRTPELFKIATRKNRSVAKEILNDTWIRGLSRLSSLEHLREFLDLARIVGSTPLDPQRPDSVTWTWTTDGAYSCRSAYQACRTSGTQGTTAARRRSVRTTGPSILRISS
ncbi:hypothetical protein BRADI_4g32781v3 [Brachypodium distachyon]|uniref:Uncharacterized protein n=1 Tax=Brachypodium distachyon TaxID=15368 RepID=A0A2K2CRW1_BRADI|nr:hypothetical protein BRADI_4g32781v3 [Brachypodium distachyon]